MPHPLFATASSGDAHHSNCLRNSANCFFSESTSERNSATLSSKFSSHHQRTHCSPTNHCAPSNFHLHAPQQHREVHHHDFLAPQPPHSPKANAHIALPSSPADAPAKPPAAVRAASTAATSSAPRSNLQTDAFARRGCAIRRAFAALAKAASRK